MCNYQKLKVLPTEEKIMKRKLGLLNGKNKSTTSKSPRSWYGMTLVYHNGYKIWFFTLIVFSAPPSFSITDPNRTYWANLQKKLKYYRRNFNLRYLQSTMTSSKNPFSTNYWTSAIMQLVFSSERNLEYLKKKNFSSVINYY